MSEAVESTPLAADPDLVDAGEGGGKGGAGGAGDPGDGEILAGELEDHAEDHAGMSPVLAAALARLRAVVRGAHAIHEWPVSGVYGAPPSAMEARVAAVRRLAGGEGDGDGDGGANGSSEMNRDPVKGKCRK